VRKNLTRSLLGLSAAILTGWAIYSLVPGFDDPNTPETAPIPAAEKIEPHTNPELVVPPETPSMASQVLDNIQEKAKSTGSYLADKVEKMNKTGQDLVQSLPSLSDLNLPPMPELPAMPELPSLPSMPAMPSLADLPSIPDFPTVTENVVEPEPAKTDNAAKILPPADALSGRDLPPEPVVAAPVAPASPLIDTTKSPDVAPNPSALSARLAREVDVMPEPEAAQPTPAKPEKAEAAEPPASIVLKEIRFRGVKSFSNDSMNAMVAKFIGIPLQYDDLLDVAYAVENFYKKNNYLARVMLTQQDITEGVLTLDVMESVLSKVKVEQQLAVLPSTQDHVLALIDRQSPQGRQFTADTLDRGLSLANEVPGVSVTGSLHQGDEEGETELILKMYKLQSRQAELVADNIGSRATGANRVMGNYSFINPTGYGDLLSLSTIVTKGSEYFRGAYSLPIGLDGWRAGLNASAMDYKVIVGDIGVVGAVGKAFTQGLDFVYPFERSPDASSTVTLSAEAKQFTNIMATGNVLSDYDAEVLVAQFSGVDRDFSKASGLLNYSFQVSHGQIRLQDGSSYQATDMTGNRTEGRFNKVRVQMSYLEPWDDKTDWFINFSGQVGNKNLDSSEKFQLGGAMGIRAYPTGEGSGSDGKMVNFEVRHRLKNGITLTGFYDWGHVDELHIPNTNNPTLKNSYDLQGFGVSAAYNFKNGVSAKATWATRDGENPNPKIPSGTDQDGSRDRNRYWLQVSIPF
jgi:hemolysin activation/secretion protein